MSGIHTKYTFVLVWDIKDVNSWNLSAEWELERPRRVAVMERWEKVNE